MKNNINLNNKGFSLLELLVTLAISAFVILGALSLVLVGTKSYQNNNENTSVQKEASFTTNILGENIRDAKAEQVEILYNIDGKKDLQINTQNKSITYYDDLNSLCIDSGNIGAAKKSYSKTNLVSKYIEGFKVTMIDSGSNEITAPTASNAKYTTVQTASNAKENVTALKFEITFKFADKTDTTTVIYNMRNTN